VSYAIITVGGKQYRVREGERLLVDRVAVDDGKTFTPDVLLIGGDGEPQLDPKGVVVTAKVLGQRRGPKIRIGKYKKRTGYRRHTGFRAALTQIEIESIGSRSSRRTTKSDAPAEAPKETVQAAQDQAEATIALPQGYADLTVAAIKEAARAWDGAALRTALEYEQAHGKRKGAIAALEAALADKE
jgi:large subunit ribosomal protein L21